MFCRSCLSRLFLQGHHMIYDILVHSALTLWCLGANRSILTRSSQYQRSLMSSPNHCLRRMMEQSNNHVQDEPSASYMLLDVSRENLSCLVCHILHQELAQTLHYINSQRGSLPFVVFFLSSTGPSRHSESVSARPETRFFNDSAPGLRTFERYCRCCLFERAHFILRCIVPESKLARFRVVEVCKNRLASIQNPSKKKQAKKKWIYQSMLRRKEHVALRTYSQHSPALLLMPLGDITLGVM